MGYYTYIYIYIYYTQYICIYTHTCILDTICIYFNCHTWTVSMLGDMHKYLQGPHAQEQKGESPCVPFGEGAISAIGSGAAPARGAPAL